MKKYFLVSFNDFIKLYSLNKCLFDNSYFEKNYPNVYKDLLPKDLYNKCYENCILNLNYNKMKGTLKSFPIIVECDLSDGKLIDLVSGDIYYESTNFDDAINSSLLLINNLDDNREISKDNVVKLLKMLDKNDVFVYRVIISFLNQKANMERKELYKKK